MVKIVKNPWNGRLNNLNDSVLNVLRRYWRVRCLHLTVLTNWHNFCAVNFTVREIILYYESSYWVQDIALFVWEGHGSYACDGRKQD